MNISDKFIMIAKEYKSNNIDRKEFIEEVFNISNELILEEEQCQLKNEKRILIDFQKKIV